jgi:hypothetical protein
MPRAPGTLGRVANTPKLGADGMPLVPTSIKKNRKYTHQCKKCKRYVQRRHRAQHASECAGTGEWDEAFGGALNVRNKLVDTASRKPRMPTHARDGKRARNARGHFRKHASRRQPRTAPRDDSENDALRLVRAIKGGHKGAVGKPPKERKSRPRDSVAGEERETEGGQALSCVSLSMPKDVSLPQCELVIRAVCSSSEVCTFIFLGSCLAASNSEKSALACLAQHLPDSRLVHLNIGEFSAPGCEFVDILRALEHPSCIVGYMFAECAVLPDGMKRKMRDALRKNRAKLAHKLQFARHLAVARLGAHTWFMPPSSTIERMEYIQCMHSDIVYDMNALS